MKSRVLLLCSMLGLCSAVGVAHAAETATQADGRTHFRRGVDFYREGDYRAAQIEFKRAYELAPNYKVLYNLGQTSLELQDYASALQSFERYLTDGGKDIAPLRRAQIEADIQKLEKRVAKVELTTNVPDAEIFVDDVSVGKTPLLAPLAVSAGRRKISALKGGLTAIRVIELVGGDSAKVSLEIAEPAAPTAAPPPPAPLPEPPPPAPRATEALRPFVMLPPPAPAPTRAPAPRNSGLWIGVVVTGALATGAVITGSLAVSALKDFDKTIGEYGVDPGAVDDARRKTRTLALVGDILAGAAVLSGGITVVAALSGGGLSKDTASLRLNVTPGGVLATGSF